ncbi:hypothetical protein GCM10029992_09380 [Glycomyces albus]
MLGYVTTSTETSENTAVTIPDPASRGRSGWRAATVLAAAAAGAIAAVIALDSGGAIQLEAIPGLSAADPAVTWSAGLLKYAYDLLMLASVGCTVAAAVFLPGRPGDRSRLSAQAWRWLRIGSVAAGLWALVALVRVPVEYANTFALGFDDLTRSGAWSYLTQADQGTSLGLTAVLALAAAVLAARSFKVVWAAAAAAAAIGAAMPPIFTGHSAANGNHQIAVDGLIIHVVAACFWAGGLLALFIARTDPAVAVRRYSAAAAFAYPAVGASGLIVFLANVDFFDLWNSDYGRIALAKAALLAVGGLIGWAHRRRTIPAVNAGDRRAFWRLAAVELAVMAAAFGLAASLSVTPPPSGELPDPNAAFLGFATPGPITFSSLMLDWYPAVLVCTAATFGVGFYIAGVVRLRRRGDAWPWIRTAMWIAGWTVVVLVTSTGLGKYGLVLFSAHMVQHMALNMLAPVFLVLGAPVTLALRAIRPRRSGGPGNGSSRSSTPASPDSSPTRSSSWSSISPACTSCTSPGSSSGR